MNTVIQKALQSLFLLPDRFLEYVRPQKPYDFLKAQPPSMASMLPYEAFIAGEHPTCLLSDGSLGICWKLFPVEHEIKNDEEIKRHVDSLAEIFANVRDDQVTFQIFFEAEPSAEFSPPETCSVRGPDKIFQNRVESVRALAQHPKGRLKLMKRRIYLTVRLGAQKSIRSRMLLGGNASELEAEQREFVHLLEQIKHKAQEIEYTLRHAGLGFQVVDAQEFLSLLRSIFHDASEQSIRNSADFNSQLRLGNQVLRDFVTLTPSHVGVGDDVWEVASWLDQPPTFYAGMMARLLEIDEPFRVVLNIRPCNDVSDLETKKMFLKGATDSYGEIQREEVKAVQDALARGEKIACVSLHIFLRSQKQNSQRSLKTLLSRLKTALNMDFVVERYAAPALFFLSLPFGFSAAGAACTGREQRLLTRQLASYLPVFGGFQGTPHPLQLMVSRAGEAIWLNPFDSQTSPHVAVLASSGAGKSFFQQNMMMGLFSVMVSNKSKKDHPLLFIIDKKTSYEIFTCVVGEDYGSLLVKPPEYFPNIFQGRLDEYRLPVLVGILKTAISLVSPDARLGALEEMALSDAVRVTFEQNELDARTEYTDGALREKSIQRIQIPRLSGVVENLFPVCAQKGTPTTVAKSLAEYLSPFLGSGPYAALFDREAYEEFESPTPGVSLFDIDAVSSHSVLSTLTAQMILAEILRQIRRPENRGRTGMLVIEEAGVLAEGSPELVLFIQDAWKTFRKLGFACVGLTNEVDDYVRKAGPREIWNVSPNKVILKMTDKDLQKARMGSLESGFPPLIENTHLAQVIGSLKKEDGIYAQGLWWSDETKGTFVYMPTGYDYWCAASKPTEINTVHDVKKRLGSYFQAVYWLATHFPRGVLDARGRIRTLTQEELPPVQQESL